MKTNPSNQQQALANWIQARTEEMPDKTAVIDPHASLTFRQLAERACSISGYIQSAIKNFTPVALFMEKSCEAMAALIGVILSGRYYCVLDTALPAARLLQLTSALKASDGTSCKIVLTDAGNLEKAQAVFDLTQVQLVCVEQIADTKQPLEEFFKNTVRVTEPALTPLYCSFTSGSTGTPKGVLISHQNVLDFIPTFDEMLGITDTDVLACQAPFDFDISVKDIFTCLYRGATLVLIPRAYFVNPTLLMDYLEEHKVTTLIWAVSALLFLTVMDAFSYKKLPLVHRIIYSGEVMPMPQLRYLHEHFSQARFVNVYGPTEITCNCTYHILEEADFEKEEVPIGTAFPGRRVFLLDDADEVMKYPAAKTVAEEEDKAQQDSIGEICVAGDGLAIGYLEDGLPVRDRSWQSIALISSPTDEDDEHLQTDGEHVQSGFQFFLLQSEDEKSLIERIYRTGDLATYAANGELLYRGRRDRQIKMHGHRIELTEVEHYTNLIPGVRRSCCIFDEAKERLILYMEGSATGAEIRDGLLTKLPAYMVPKKIVHAERLPLNRHGKIDREAIKKQNDKNE